MVLIKSAQEELRCLYPECMASPWPPTSHSTEGEIKSVTCTKYNILQTEYILKARNSSESG